MKKNNAPEIRFVGFDEDWDDWTLESLVDRVKSYSLSRDAETCEYTGYKYVHYGDIHTKVADIIDESSNLPNIKAESYEPLQKGDLILADASEDYQGIATPAVVTIHTPYKLVAGLHTIALRPQNADSLFLYYLFTSSIFKKYGYKVGTGMKVFGISFSNLVKFESKIPLLAEQTAIGNFFKQLDDTIALHQRELDYLKQAKQGFLQKMFPKEGETVPEIRFPGFSGEWEEREIGKITKSYSGGTPTAGEENYYNGNIPFIRSGEINCTNTELCISEVGLKNSSAKMIKEGDILYALYGATSGEVGRSKITGAINQAILAIFPKQGYDSEFILHIFRKEKQNIISKYLQGGQGNLSGAIVKKLVFNFPSIKEQTQIGNFFKQLDDTIALHERELETLKQTKKAFLQKMFV